MTRLFYQTQHFAQIATPLVQCLIGRLLLLEVDNPRRSVDFGSYGLVRHQLAKRTLSSVWTQVEKLGQPRQRDLSVVRGYHTDVLRKDVQVGNGVDCDTVSNLRAQ